MRAESNSGKNEIDTVEEKQNNTIEFVNYCRVLYQAANLVFWSEIDKNINID